VEIGFGYGAYSKENTYLGCANIYPPYRGLCEIFSQSNKNKVSPDYDNYPQKFTGYPQHNRMNMC